MNVGRIPRLQELSYLEIAAIAVAEKDSLDAIRKRLIRHMISLRDNYGGAGNIADLRGAHLDRTKYMSNTLEALRELMKLKFLTTVPLPSNARALAAYHSTPLTLTTEGTNWTALLARDPRAAYDLLLSALWRAHPQLPGYMRALSPFGIAIPLANWTDLREPRDRERYVDYLAHRVATGTTSELPGGHTSESEALDAIRAYLDARATARKRRLAFPTTQEFVSACEEAVVKFAFKKRGVQLDYISQEIIRRWTKELGIANFSYHVPGVQALCSWPTADIREDQDTILPIRRIGPEQDRLVVEALPDAYETSRSEQGLASLWVPIYSVRAAVCWKLRIADAIFDRALVAFLRDNKSFNVPYSLGIDQTHHGAPPPTELPLQVQTSRGTQNFHSLSLLRRHERSPS